MFTHVVIQLAGCSSCSLLLPVPGREQPALPAEDASSPRATHSPLPQLGKEACQPTVHGHQPNTNTGLLLADKQPWLP